jgi:hypothetical protein
MCKVPHNKYFVVFKNSLICNLFLVFPVKSRHMNHCNLEHISVTADLVIL